MESFAFPVKIKSMSTENPQKCSKWFFFSLELFEYSLYILDWYSMRNISYELLNQKAKPHKQSLIVGGQNGIWVLGMCRFAPDEFGNND